MRKVKLEKVFPNTGIEFSAINDAEKWLKENGYSVGPMDATAHKCAIFHGNYVIGKWRNLDHKEKDSIDGILTYSDARNGEVKVVLYE